jgi:hypothetical protein
MFTHGFLFTWLIFRRSINVGNKYMAIDLQTIDERLAKAREDAEFWEKAKEVLSDPRITPLSTPQFRAPATSPSPVAPRLYGEVKQRVYAVLPNADSKASLSTNDIVELLEKQGYVFNAKDSRIAVNGALTALEKQGIAHPVEKVRNARYWRRKKMDGQDLGNEKPA